MQLSVSPLLFCASLLALIDFQSINVNSYSRNPSRPVVGPLSRQRAGGFIKYLLADGDENERFW